MPPLRGQLPASHGQDGVRVTKTIAAGALAIIVALAAPALAQDHGDMPMGKPAPDPAEKPAEKPAEEPAEQPAEKPAEQPAEQPAEKPAEQPAPPMEHERMPMEHSGVLGLPEARGGSGTSWQPDSTPIYGWHTMAGGWMLMLHTSLFVGYDYQGGDRGDDAIFSANWVMGMAKRELGDGELVLRTMLSLEPATMPGDGYPLLLQTGESFEGELLHDRQHPHDLFMEIGALYRHALGNALAFELYAAAAGEPALGPTAFPHRFSAMANPWAPLGHHWQDSTHITFGVLTAGLFTRHIKLEGSWFNGREPDEERWDLDLRAPDSFAGRLSVNPGRDWSAQASYGYLKSPEGLEPDESLQRASASLGWNHRLADSGDVSLFAALGHNAPEDGPATHSVLLEGTLLLSGHHLVFSRAELVTKTGKELVLEPTLADETFALTSISLGLGHDFDPIASVVPGVGVVGSLNFVGSDLESVYGTKVPFGAMVFIRLHAPELKLKPRAAMHMGSE